MYERTFQSSATVAFLWGKIVWSVLHDKSELIEYIEKEALIIPVQQLASIGYKNNLRISH